MNDAPAVRAASPGDADVLARLLTEFNAEFGEEAPPQAALATRLARSLSEGTMRAWLVRATPPAGPSEPAGYATLAIRASAYCDGPVGMLEDLYVRAPLRARGLGTALMTTMLEEAEAAGLAMIEVGVDEPDTDALRFYERHGFVHRRPETGDRAFYLSRDLPGA
ncbi:GNAT family N-acetyltransferase [Demequina pelophila]|uniref:GNAT family N-acetyltransferase n=1 Tax=Demequina pelophila TaxID=1638984 RepID=UPI00078069E2|nr:GNAT family N-acetyltransferase [Demequina pelophila]